MALRDHVHDIDLFDSRELVDARDDMEPEDQEALDQLIGEVEGYSGDRFEDGIGFVGDWYFTTYAQDLADDIGAIDRNAAWPTSGIDWEQAARELQMDYTSVEVDGATYWYR